MRGRFERVDLAGAGRNRFRDIEPVLSSTSADPKLGLTPDDLRGVAHIHRLDAGNAHQHGRHLNARAQRDLLRSICDGDRSGRAESRRRPCSWHRNSSAPARRGPSALRFCAAPTARPAASSASASRARTIRAREKSTPVPAASAIGTSEIAKIIATLPLRARSIARKRFQAARDPDARDMTRPPIENSRAISCARIGELGFALFARWLSIR